MTKFGIDISEWQKGFNFDKAVSEGVEFVILRGAYKMSKDKCFEDFYKACKARKIPVGVYHYSMAKTVEEAKNEANFLITNVLKGKQFEYPIYMDVEDKTQLALGKTLLTDIVVAFCETLEKAGYYVGIYTTAFVLDSYMHESKLVNYDKWIANWSKKCTYSGNYGMWQFGGETNLIRSNKIAGVTCDQDYAYKDYPSIIKNAGLNGYSKPQTIVTKSLETLAQEVISGKWGAGVARKNELTKAYKSGEIAYTYKEVQDKVNELLKQSSKSLTTLAQEVISGKWGAGIKRKLAINKAYKAGEIAYTYTEIQTKVNELYKKGV